MLKSIINLKYRIATCPCATSGTVSGASFANKFYIKVTYSISFQNLIEYPRKEGIPRYRIPTELGVKRRKNNLKYIACSRTKQKVSPGMQLSCW